MSVPKYSLMYDLSDSRAMLPVLIVLYFSNNNNESLSNEASVSSLTTGDLDVGSSFSCDNGCD